MDQNGTYDQRFDVPDAHAFGSSLRAAAATAQRLSRDLSRGGLAGLLGMASRGVGLALRYPAHRRWMAVIGGATTRRLLTLYPRIAYRHATTYLFHGATWQQRMTMLTGHYAFLNEMYDATFFDEVLEPGGVPVWRHAVEDHRLTINLHGPCLASRHREGELSLVFAMNDVPLYRIAFSVVRDATVTLGLTGTARSEGDALYVGQVQGVAGHLDLLRAAARLCGGIAPRDLLMSAVGGVARAWGIERVLGASDARRLSRPAVRQAAPGFAYDPFWTQYQAESDPAGHAVMTLPFHEGPAGGASSAHRRRARIRRHFKAGVSEAVAVMITGQERRVFNASRWSSNRGTGA